ncbi:MAG: peptidoglycan bridge formation glycyltransferase FemA/FemB family protein [Patescibacteria group bacterium]|jgi:lipid II:glycine glycyltransferase (peptidoglycan interpeptide bridge formation enzyme)
MATFKLQLTQDAAAFTAFLAEQSTDQFLQSWDWGEFQSAANRVVRRFFISDESNNNVASVQAIAMPLPAGCTYWYIPRGPVWHRDLSRTEWPDVLKTIIEGLHAEHTGRRLVFTRLEPGWARDDGAISLADLPTRIPIKVLPKTVQPGVTLILDLKLSEEEILTGMHSKTRYNIRLAEKKGVTIRTATDDKSFEAFWRLMQATAERNKITQHTQKYYHNLLRTLKDSKLCPARLYLAEQNGNILAANLVLRYDQTVVYLHGASGNEGRNLMAPHLLQWQTIHDAKRDGAIQYDFWGIAENDDPRHAWAGITRFKKGFGGRIVTYAAVADAVYQPVWYAGYGLLKKILK